MYAAVTSASLRGYHHQRGFQPEVHERHADQAHPSPPAPPATAAEHDGSRHGPQPAGAEGAVLWQAAAVMGAAMLYFLGSDLLSWNQELNIVRNGTAVSAVITRIGEAESPGARQCPAAVSSRCN